MIFPVAVMGSSATNSTMRGYSCAASRERTNSCSSAASAGPAEGDAAHLPRRQLAPFFIDDAHGVARDRRSRPARTHRGKRDAVSHHEIAFGLAVELVDGEAERAAAPLDQILAEALAAAR